jgi:hypothetical protein
MKFDTYTRRARLYPALLVVLPLGIATLAWFPEGLVGWGTLWGLVVWSGGTALLSQVGRDKGKAKEPGLFEQWGGMPTTRMLRHRHAPNSVTLARRHKKLQELLPNVKIPTLAEEEADPTRADEVYRSCTTFIIARTRDQKRFPLVFEENCNYGFRRNLWGMKALGLATAVAGTGAVAALLMWDFLRNATPAPLALACGLGNLTLLAGWLFWFTPKWVRIPAVAYAGRLLEASEKL